MLKYNRLVYQKPFYVSIWPRLQSVPQKVRFVPNGLISFADAIYILEKRS